MSTAQELWDDVDAYFTTLLTPADEVLTAALRESEAAGLPAINVAPNQGKLLQLLALVQGARRILEIGTLGGYSTIWLGRALPADGRLITLEYDAKHAEVARRNLTRAGLDGITEVRVGPALESLPKLTEEQPEPFDLVFIDADKVNNPHYLEWALKLTRPGSLIVLDNVVRGGRVTDAGSEDPSVRGTRAALELMASHPKLSATAVQTVGSKGYDGFAWHGWWTEPRDSPQGSRLVVEAHVDAARGGAVLDDQLARAAVRQPDRAAVGQGLGRVPGQGQQHLGRGLGVGTAQPGDLPTALGAAQELQVDARDEQPVVGGRQPAHGLVPAHPQHGARLAGCVGHQHAGRRRGVRPGYRGHGEFEHVRSS